MARDHRAGAPALRLHGEHLPLADRGGGDARRAAPRGARGRRRNRQRGHRRLARRRPARPPRHGRRAGPRHRDGRSGAAGRGGRLRPLRPAPRGRRRERRGAAGGRARRRCGREGAAAAGVRPAGRRGGRPRRARPLLRRSRRLRARGRPRAGGGGGAAGGAGGRGPRVKEALAAALGEPVADLTPVAGGDLNAAYRATLAGGRRGFANHSPDATPGAYAAEAAGLRWLAEPCALPVPEVLAAEEAFLALAWVDGGGRPAAEALGRGLAGVHRAGAPAPGAQPPGVDGPLRLGPLALPNEPAATWPAFYAANRLVPLARMAADRGTLDAGGVRAVEAVAARIDALAGPQEPVARLHGDLWSGNVH